MRFQVPLESFLKSSQVLPHTHTHTHFQEGSSLAAVKQQFESIQKQKHNKQWEGENLWLNHIKRQTCKECYHQKLITNPPAEKWQLLETKRYPQCLQGPNYLTASVCPFEQIHPKTWSIRWLIGYGSSQSEDERSYQHPSWLTGRLFPVGGIKDSFSIKEGAILA